MMILNLASSMQQQITMLAHHNYDNFQKHLMVKHEEVNDKTLGIIGYGNIGKEVIQVASALGMKILVYTRSQHEDFDDVHFTTLHEVLSQSDYISLHCPLNEQTKHMIGRDELALMKPNACIINTARGALIDEKALIEALENHHIAGAGLDVQEEEPIDPTSPLFAMSQVIVTPHMGWKGLETRQRLIEIVKKDITAFVEGKPINRII